MELTESQIRNIVNGSYSTKVEPPFVLFVDRDGELCVAQAGSLDLLNVFIVNSGRGVHVPPMVLESQIREFLNTIRR